MIIAIDGFGGDNVPLEPLRGAEQAVKELDVDIVITGDEQKLHECAKENNVSLERITIVDAATVMPIDEDPVKILKEYSQSSMAVGLDMVYEGAADAFVSAGSTGALLVGSTFIVKRIKGIKRPALASPIPMQGKKFYLLVDSGANHDCRPDMLTQFAVMGVVYQNKIMNIDNPRVGLVNIGAEKSKGTDLQKQTYVLLEQAPFLNFVGNVEARDLPNDGCDVAVCDGFTGNIILKLSEGFGRYFGGILKDIFYSNVISKLAGAAVDKQLKDFKKSLDYKEYGGVPILGLEKPVIKAHGSSNGLAFKNAIRQAKNCIEQNVCEEIAQGVARFKEISSQEN